MTIAEIKDLAAILAAIAALLALFKGILEYIKQGAQKRAEHFLVLRERQKNNESFKHICNLLEIDDLELRNVSLKEKINFLGLLEEVAIAMNSGLIKPTVTHYMFGYYTIRCWESHNFWSDVNRESIYWIVFKDFAAQMKNIEEKFSYNRQNFRF